MADAMLGKGIKRNRDTDFFFFNRPSYTTVNEKGSFSCASGTKIEMTKVICC